MRRLEDEGARLWLGWRDGTRIHDPELDATVEGASFRRLVGSDRSIRAESDRLKARGLNSCDDERSENICRSSLGEIAIFL